MPNRLSPQSNSLTIGQLPKSPEFVAVIIAGGSGTRFWPKSRVKLPKQYLPLNPDGRSLIRATVDRILPLSKNPAVLIVTAESQLRIAQEHVPEACIIGEPCPRNTAAALAYAAQKVLHSVGDVPMLCMHSDHLVMGEDRLREIIRAGIDLVQTDDVLAAIGIQPNAPETGFGYIKRGEAYRTVHECQVWQIDRFVEKPPLEQARAFLRSGEYYWNAGMFLWRPSVLLAEIATFLPDLSASAEKFSGTGSDDAVRELFPKLESISIDHGILERSSRTVMLPGDGFVWSDIGSWELWASNVEAFRGGNAESENVSIGDVIAIDCQNSAFWSEKRLIAAIGVENIVVVETEDAVLICNRNNSQDVRKVVEALQKAGRKDSL